MAWIVDTVGNDANSLINHDLVLRHAGLIHELAEHGKNCLLRGIDLVVDIGVTGIAIVAIHLQCNYFMLCVTNVLAIMSVVVIAEDFFPGLPIVLSPGESLERAGGHLVSQITAFRAALLE